jgi:hypothetical protein
MTISYAILCNGCASGGNSSPYRDCGFGSLSHPHEEKVQRMQMPNLASTLQVIRKSRVAVFSSGA